MKIEPKTFLISGYLALLVINATEFRSGIWLSLFQLLLGLLLLLPKVFIKLKWGHYARYEVALKIAYLSAILAGIGYKWYDAPNHMFLFFYLSLVLLYVENENNIRTNFRWMFVIIMGFATLHKVINPNFTSGDFLAYRLLSGDFFQPIYTSGLLPQVKEVLDQNYEAIREFVRSESFLSGQIRLKNVTPNLMAGLKLFTYSIIGMEFLVAILFAFFHRKLALIVLLIFVTSIGLIVSEFEFAATLLFMGTIFCPPSYRILRSTFLAAFVLYVVLGLLNNIMLW